VTDWTKVPNWKYGVREDESIWISIGDPVNGPHQQFDFHGTEDLAQLFCQIPEMLKSLQSIAKK
jgi:hypothetical protein